MCIETYFFLTYLLINNNNNNHNHNSDASYLFLDNHVCVRLSIDEQIWIEIMSANTLKAEAIDFDQSWPIVLGTVQSVINMSRYGHTDKPTWQTRFFGWRKFLHENLLNSSLSLSCRYLSSMFGST